MKKKKFKTEFLFIIPSVIGVLIFYLIPFFDVTFRSFVSEFNGEYVWLDNYVAVIHNKAFGIALKNTLKFIMIYIPALLIFSMLITLFLDYVKKSQKLYKKLFLLPMAIPITSLVVIWNIIFDQNGILNRILNFFGIAGADYFNSTHAFIVLGITYIWRNFGYNMILWQTGMSSIETDIYEAAALDGAGYIKRFIYITLPQLKEMGFVIIIISILNSFKVFREAYLIAGDYPNQSIYLFQHLFNNWFVKLEMGKLTAGAVLIAIFILFFSICLKKALYSKEKKHI